LPNVIGGSILCNWTVTQKLDIQSQLLAGIRYLDFRVGVKKYSNNQSGYEFYLVHGQCANTLAEELQNVAEFLSDHPREVVLIDCNHCYDFKTPEQISDFENLVLKVSPIVALHMISVLHGVTNETVFGILVPSCTQSLPR
uniref:PLCXc domain-containing protein n=1 Tax=Echinostoma caproni TaxID=27848 RepID=A0A183A3A4_9TREM